MRLTFDAPVTLLGAGALGPGDLSDSLRYAPQLIAADGGANAAISAGYVPRSVIGDMDSLDAQTRAALDPGTLVPVTEQDSTDFEKCLSRIDAPLVIGVGFLGGRVDHELAALGALVRLPSVCVLLGARDAVVHLARPLALNLPSRTRLSLFPMAAVRGISEGLEWPIDGLAFAPNGRIGTSNRVVGPVRIAMDGPGMLLIVPRAALAALLAGISSWGR